MATTGLIGVWGHEQLDRTGISAWRLLILCAVVGDLLGIILASITGVPNPDSPLSTYYTREVTGLTIFGVCGMIGLTIALNIILARTTETDLRKLPGSDSIDACINDLRPRAVIFLPAILTITLFSILASPVLTSQSQGISLWEAFIVFYDAGPPLRLLLVVLWPLLGIGWGIGFAIGITQIASLIKAARTVHIDLFQLDQYNILANPTIRVILCVLVIWSFFPLFMFLIDDPVVDEQITKLMVLLLVPIVPALFGWGYPILILRNRIKLKKAEELDTLLLAMRGDDEALARSCIPKRGDNITTADLLTHRMFIESRWEWPIGAHIQKLIAFGLLPPLTWVLAALVEHSFF